MASLSFVFWDVQHGSATYIKTPNNRHIAIDLGTGSYGNSNNTFSPLLHLKNYYSVDQLAAVIITHPHRDHLDDISMFRALSPSSLYRPKHLSDEVIRNGNRQSDSAIIEKYLDLNKKYVHPIAASNDLSIPQNYGGVEFFYIIPNECPTSNLNNHSLVTIISYANSKILIPGDNESCSWDELLDDKRFLEAIKGTDIFVAPHHGRETGFSENLYKHINPSLTIVSDGRFCDTSATDRYSNKSSGWLVHKRSGGTEKRKCLTTRNDGVITVDFGMNKEDKPYIKVTIN